MNCDPLLATTDLPVSLSVDDFYMCIYIYIYIYIYMNE